MMGLLPDIAAAQSPNTAQEDETINTIRRLNTVGPADQRQINEWVQARVDRLQADVAQDPAAAFSAFRERFRSQMANSGNTQPFVAQFVAQSNEVFSKVLGRADVKPEVARALARVLADMERIETLEALLIGLKSQDQATRYLSAKALAGLKTAIAADKDALERVVSALREAGLAETNSVVLSFVYLALAYPPQQIPQVFEPYLVIMQKRLAARLSGSNTADAGELDAYEFFRSPGVAAALNADQKASLAAVLAGFLKLDAQRYATAKLSYDEQETLERRLDGAEAILIDLGAPKGGDISNELSAGGYERRNEILKQVWLWIGDPETKTAGSLNAAPWNVPVGGS